jgi:hypothetical protein
MPNYKFSDREQMVIRELGKLGYRYDRETKKTIEFVDDSLDRVIELNREHNKLALVFGFGEPSSLAGMAGIERVSDRSSSNFKKLSKGVTRTGRDNHQGIQIVMSDKARISIVVDRMSQTP